LERLLSIRSGPSILVGYGIAAAVICGLQLVPYLGWIVLAMAGRFGLVTSSIS
jgi:hypothetical protein